MEIAWLGQGIGKRNKTRGGFKFFSLFSAAWNLKDWKYKKKRIIAKKKGRLLSMGTVFIAAVLVLCRENGRRHCWAGTGGKSSL